VKTLKELDSLTEYLKDKEFVSFDTETTGLSKESEIIGFSVCADTDVAYYVILASWSVAEQKLMYLETKEGAKAFLQMLTTKKLILHNAIFDCWKVETGYNIALMPAVHTDTMLLAHLLDENRFVGLKELGVSIFGDDAKKEQEEMKASVSANGGVLTKANYELYKADADLIGKYGAKDTILTLKLFYHLIPELYEQGLEKFFYEEETMPLLKEATYELNTSGLKIDLDKLQDLKGTLEAECMEAKAFIYAEITPHVKKEYPGTGKTNVFNIGSSKQLAWLLFFKLGNEFGTLTKGGKELCKSLDFPIPYSNAAKRNFIQLCLDYKNKVYEPAKWNYKTKKMSRPKKVGEPWTYIACGKDSLKKLAIKYKWVEKYLEYAKNLKILNTYVEGIKERASYGIIRPSFLQHGTTSGRYSSRNPNFQNLPRGDKRVKSCIIARPNKVFVGADYSQLEPRVFASFSKDERLMRCFKDGDDFYSIIGAEVFDKYDCSMKKDDNNSFAKKYPVLRDISKVVGLSATYGTTAFKMSAAIGKDVNETQEVIDSYFSKFPSVQEFMLERHKTVKTEGKVVSLFGRPRRLPEALNIPKIYGNAGHSDLPYTARTTLNLAVNHTIQSTGASIMNRATIKLLKLIKEHKLQDCHLVMQVHDEIIVECLEKDGTIVAGLLKEAMENTTALPGVDLIAEPKIAKNLADLK
jgi:DNA polymerase I-like protein with 3'-5' exonuclease and polymerase domains